MAALPHLSTDQVAAFVELAREGQIRAAASALAITEQGVRNRLVALEAQLGVELYRKARGPRRAAVLTPQGQRFLPHALAFLDRARELCQACDLETGQQDVRIVASQYLTRYVLIDVLRAFRGVAPAIHVRVSTMNESDAVDALLRNSGGGLRAGRALRVVAEPALLRALRHELEPDHAAPAPPGGVTEGQPDADRAARPHPVRERIDGPAARARRVSRARPDAGRRAGDHQHRDRGQHGRGRVWASRLCR